MWMVHTFTLFYLFCNGHLSTTEKATLKYIPTAEQPFNNGHWQVVYTKLHSFDVKGNKLFEPPEKMGELRVWCHFMLFKKTVV